jgi:hypothetical protein
LSKRLSEKKKERKVRSEWEDKDNMGDRAVGKKSNNFSFFFI